jgi:hypothetical protein
MSVPKYKVGDTIYVAERNEPITVTHVMAGSGTVGYGGSYLTIYQGKPIQMSYGWIPEGLIIRGYSMSEK